MIFWKKKKPTSDSNQSSVPEESSGQETRQPDSTEPSTKQAGQEAQPSHAQTPEAPSNKVGWFRRALQKTNEMLRTDIRDLWKSEGELVDDDFLSNLYAILIRTDMGPDMATKIKDSIHDQ